MRAVRFGAFGLLFAVSAAVAGCWGVASAATHDRSASAVLHSAANATRQAPSFVLTVRQSGYRPADSGDAGTLTLVYEAPDRYRSVQHLASEPGVVVTIIQIGSDHYQEDSSHPNEWMHEQLPPGEFGWGSFLTRMFDSLTGPEHVTRVGEAFRVSVPPESGRPAQVETVTVGKKYLVSVTTRTTIKPGKTQVSKATFSHVGGPQTIRPPTGT